MGEVVLENQTIRAVFDGSTGALLELVSRETEWRLQNRQAHARAFSVVAPLPERLLNEIDGAAESVTVERDETTRTVSIAWERLTSPHCGSMPVSLFGEVSLDDGGLGFRMKVVNNSEHVVESVRWPYIGDLGLPADGETLTRMSPNYCAMRTKSLYPDFPNELGYWGTDYPMQTVPTPSHPFLLIQGESEGLYAGCHDTTAAERTEFTFQLVPGYAAVGKVPTGGRIGDQDARMEFTVTHFPLAQPGETIDLAPHVIQPYRGGWHRGADIYGEWRKTWMVDPPRPEWLDKVHSWQQIQMTSWGDSLRIRYTDLVEYAKECVRHGVDAIQLVGFTSYGQDGRLPDHDIDPRLGTREELQAAIEEIEAMGVHVVLYEKYTCADVSTDWYRRELHECASKDIFGNTHGHGGWRYHTPAHLAGINTRPYAWMCMNSKKWQDVALGEIEKSLGLKPSGILLDESQNHGEHGHYCYDENHGHTVPAHNYAGDAEFEKRALALLNRQETPMVFAGEGGYDLQYRHYNLLYHRSRPGHIAATRYIDPHLPLMDWVMGYDDRESINRCLLYRYIISYEPMNFKGHLEEFPLTLEYGKKVDALRKRYGAYLWDAACRDTVGVTVSPAGRVVHSVFVQPSGVRAVVLVNDHESEDASVVVEAESTLRSPALVSPENLEPMPATDHIRVPARSAVVLLEKGR
jgi:hypothetical protein